MVYVLEGSDWRGYYAVYTRLCDMRCVVNNLHSPQQLHSKCLHLFNEACLCSRLTSDFCSIEQLIEVRVLIEIIIA